MQYSICDLVYTKITCFFSRVGVTQRAIHEALGKVFNAMKEKEQELIGIVKESVAQKKAALSDCETKLTETVTKYNEVMNHTSRHVKYVLTVYYQAHILC